MSNKHESNHAKRPDVPYWDDSVYHYLSRQHHSASDPGDGEEVARIEKHMQDLVNQSMPDEQYWQLDKEAKTDRKKRKQERKQNQRRKPPTPSAPEGSINVTELKKRTYNPQVSRENVIKALEALPSKEKKATIAGLPPWLGRKLGQYVKGRKKN